MPFTYDAGSTTPNLAGLVEAGSIRLNDGTFELLGAPGLLLGLGAASSGVAPMGNEYGGVPGLALYPPREFTLEGQIRVPTVPDLWDAIDLLFETFDLDRGLQVLTLNTIRWTAERQITAIANGDLVIDEPADFDAHYGPRRMFSLPMIAPDPRLYSTVEHTQTITTATAVSNAGRRACPIKVRFNGPQTDPILDLAGTSGSDRIKFTGVIPDSHYVEVAAFAASAEGVYALDDTGVNAMGVDSAYGGPLAAFTARSIPKGSSSWTATNTTGSGTTVLYWRDAW